MEGEVQGPNHNAAKEHKDRLPDNALVPGEVLGAMAGKHEGADLDEGQVHAYHSQAEEQLSRQLLYAMAGEVKGANHNAAKEHEYLGTSHTNLGTSQCKDACEIANVARLGLGSEASDIHDDHHREARVGSEAIYKLYRLESASCGQRKEGSKGG